MPLGQVFTPPALAAEVLAAVTGRPARVLDPACGNGNFLIEAARRWPEAELVGYEADPAVAAEARERLPGARIEVADALGLPVAPEFDLVAGNPPYAAAFRDDGDRAAVRSGHQTARGSFDLAVPFIERAVGWLRPGGWMALVVTNKILVKDYAIRLRQWLQDELALLEVWDLAAAPAFPGTAVDVAVLIGRRAAATEPVRVVLGRKDGERESYRTARLARGGRDRWEVFITPAVADLVRELEEGPSLGKHAGVIVRDGVQGRDYHRVPITEGRGMPPGHARVGGGTCDGPLPVVGVGRIGPGQILWDHPFKRAGQIFRDPHMQVAGSFGDFCKTPKILVRGVARKLTAAFAADPVVPLVAVRTVTGFVDHKRLVAWLNDPLATFYLQVTCRSDRIPKGSYNISKAWLEALPVPATTPEPSSSNRAALLAWEQAFGI